MTAQHIKINRPRPFPVHFDVTSAQQAFDFEGPFWELADLIVYITTSGVTPPTWRDLETSSGTTKLTVSEYTVHGLFVQGGGPVVGAYGSGTVTLNAAVADCIVTIDRFIVDNRDTDFNQTAPLSQNAINSDLDRLTARDQDLIWRLGDGPSGVASTRYAHTFEVIGADPGNAGDGVIGVEPFPVAVRFGPNFAGFAFHADTPATGTATCDIEDQDGAVIGTASITSGGCVLATTGGTAKDIAAGGAMVMRRTSTADGALASFGLTLLSNLV